LVLPTSAEVEKGTTISISLFRGEREYTIPALVVFNQDNEMRVRFEEMSMDNYRSLVAATFSRSDAWQQWLPDRKTDRPLTGLAEVFSFSLEGTRRFIRSIADILPWKRPNT
jgi:cellulose synthase (UDP-forming)